MNGKINKKFNDRHVPKRSSHSFYSSRMNSQLPKIIIKDRKKKNTVKAHKTNPINYDYRSTWKISTGRFLRKLKRLSHYMGCGEVNKHSLLKSSFKKIL